MSMLIGKINNYNYRPNFTRRLRENEKADYNATINEAKNYLGIENMSMIIHGSCYPANGTDLGVGSPFAKTAEDLIKFEKLHGFDSNQLGPNGEITRAFVSPYSGTVFARNHLFIDLNELTTDKYANILSKSALNALELPENEEYIDKPYTYSEFFDAFEIYDIALKEAYTNFRNEVADGNEAALKLEEEFNEFKSRKGKEALEESLFQVLSRTYGTMDTAMWENEVDRNLISLLKQSDSNAINRYRQLKIRNSDDINSFVFGQFIADKQIKENKEFRDGENFTYINDLLVGFSPSEKWIYRDAFLENYELGCPYGGKYGPQLWEIPVLDPKKLFNSDGSLGSAGKLLKAKIEAAFETGENIRIDHVLGLVDPYVYDRNSVHIVNGHLDGSRFSANNISQMRHLDPDGNYKKILGEIVLPILKERGLKPEDAVWEDLGCQTDTFRHIYYDVHKLPGITQLEWNRGEYTSRNNTALVGSHDSPPAIRMIKNDQIKSSDAWNVDYLSGYLNTDNTRLAEREQFKQRISADPMERVKAKFVELLVTAKNIQISFADFFGIDKIYNRGGQNHKENWKLRLNENYEDSYYKNLESDYPTALNMPELLKDAVQAKMDLDIMRGGDGIDQRRETLHHKIEPLLDKLDQYANILKEETP